MAHPNEYLGKGGIIVIDENQGAVSAPTGKVFCAILNTGALKDDGTTVLFLKFFQNSESFLLLK